MNDKYRFYFSKIKKSHIISGFTLIELLVTLTIISVLFGLGYANFRNYQQKQAVMGAVRDLEGDIKYAAELAYSGSKPTSGCGTLVGYRVKILPAENAYQITRVCINGGFTEDLDPPYKKVTLPSNLVIGKMGSRDNIIFKTLGQGTDASTAESDPPARFTVQLSNSTIEASVYIYRVGETTVQFE